MLYFVFCRDTVYNHLFRWRILQR